MLRLPQPQPEGPRSVEEIRAGFRALMAQMVVPDTIRTTQTTLGSRPALRVEPDNGPRVGTILYFHGGGWVFGSPETALSLTGHLVAKTGFGAHSLDYRLAPEHPFPAAIEDTLSAYRALLDSGTDPSTIVFAGDSAGGGLTITTCLAAREAGLPLPAAIVAFSPGLDATRTGESMDTEEGIDPIFTREALQHTGAMYLAGADPHQPLLSPAVLADLTGFPPMLIQGAPTRSCWTTPRASPRVRGRPEWTSSWTSPQTCRTCSRRSPAYWTRQTRHWTARLSSSASASALRARRTPQQSRTRAGPRASASPRASFANALTRLRLPQHGHCSRPRALAPHMTALSASAHRRAGSQRQARSREEGGKADDSAAGAVVPFGQELREALVPGVRCVDVAEL
ncbi:alpha/beta hydrolase [Streptomyces caniferus]|uniref:alpha/beta hydrolase n=1 Tax=Streptomyces caniferus TaxID=285557 RepID=UPI0038248318